MDAPALGSENLGSLWQSSNDLFASEDNSHCPIFFTKSMDALAHEWPSLPLYASPSIALLPQVLRRVREQWHKLILIAPLWRNQPWVSELLKLLEAAPWPIPLRRDLLFQANGPLWHPRPELWALHVWPLNRSLLTYQSTIAEARAPSTRRLYARAATNDYFDNRLVGR